MSVDVPLPPGVKLTLVGLTEADRPVGDDDVDRATVPANPAMLLSVMVDVPDPPALKLNVVGLDEIVKSPMPTRMVVECDSGPLVPVTVTVYVPRVEELKLHVDEAEPPEVKERIDGLQDALRPADGLIDCERLTLPANPPRLVNVMVEVPLDPDGKFTVVGLADME